MTRRYSNVAVETTLSAPCTAGETTILVTETTGFPAVDFILAINAGTSNQELVLVTNVAGLTLTVTRGYDGTTRVAHVVGATVQHSHAAIDFRESRTHEEALTAHGTTGNVVGTSDTQTLTNKTVSLGSNTLTGTKAQFDAALSDGDFATLAGFETLTNKTLTSPTLNTPNVNSPTISNYTSATHSHANAAGGGQLTDAALSAPVTVAKGGTGAATHTSGELLVGNGTSPVTSLAVSDLYQAGMEEINLGATGSAGTEKTQAVVFPVPFATTPRIFVQSQGGDPTYYAAWEEGVTTTGFTMHAIRKGSTGQITVDFAWFAVVE